MFPWNFFGTNKSNFDPFSNLHENEFQQMLEQWMKQAFPSYLHSMKHDQRENKPSAGMNETVFETHDYIYIRIPISDEEQLQHLRIYYSLNKCMIDGLSKTDSPHSIILPATVKKKGAKAIYRDKILEIKIPKSSEWQLSEIDVDKY